MILSPVFSQYKFLLIPHKMQNSFLWGISLCRFRKLDFFLGPFLISRNTVTQYFVVPHRVLSLPAAIAGITLDGIDNTVFAFFHDAHMVGLSVLGAGRTAR